MHFAKGTIKPKYKINANRYHIIGLIAGIILAVATLYLWLEVDTVNVSVLRLGLISSIFFLVAFLALGTLKARAEIVTQQRDQLELIYQATFITSSSSNINYALRNVISLVCKTKSWPIGHIYQVDKENPKLLTPTNIWFIKHGLNIDKFRYRIKETKLESGQGLPGKVYQSKASVWVEDIGQDKGLLHVDLYQDLNIASAVALPILHNEELLYVLEFYSVEPRPYIKYELKTLNILGDTLGQLWGKLITEQALIDSEERTRLLLEAAGEGIFGLDKTSKITFVNPAAERLLGYQSQEVVGKEIHTLIQHSYPNGDEYPTEKSPIYDTLTRGNLHQIDTEYFWREDGTCFPVEYASTPMKKGNKVIGAVITFNNISKQVEAQEKLEKLALYDYLTGFYNRAHFEELLRQAIARAKRHHAILGLIYLDLDNFKYVNDNLGHDAGDELLREVAVRLRESLRDIDMVARLGGDEFAIVLEDLRSPYQAGRVTHRLIKKIRRPFEIQKQEIKVSLSAGIACYPKAGDTPQDLAKHADIALYRAKSLGKNQHQFYTKEISAQYMRQLDLELGLKNAVAHKELFLVYQPIYQVPEQKVIGFEALLRWQHPQLGLVPAIEFIRVAEDIGEIETIELWVIERACVQFKQLNENLPKASQLAINLSAREIYNRNHIERIRTILSDANIDLHAIIFEITETAIMQASESSIDNLQLLREMGCKIAIDDFGIDYSSFNRLSELPVDILKIDASFVRKMMSAPKNAIIVKTIIKLAKELDLHVVAEGVENQIQLEFLAKNDCHIMQGYYLAKPQSFEDALKLLSNA